MTYPGSICQPCGVRYGKPRRGTSTWSMGECDFCGKVNEPVTEPRDFGYPKLPRKRKQPLTPSGSQPYANDPAYLKDAEGRN